MTGIGNKEMTDRINREFGLFLTVSQINSYKKRYKISSGLTGHFEKGQIPNNKGIKQPGKTNQTSFNIGNTPHNKLPVGTETMRSDGYVRIKIAEPSKWRYKHVFVWESKNGKKPLKHVIVFADQNRRNFDLDNLILVSQEELFICNTKGLLFPDKQLSKSGILVSKVLAKARTRRG